MLEGTRKDPQAQLLAAHRHPQLGAANPCLHSEVVKPPELRAGGVEGTHSPESGSGFPTETFKERKAKGCFDEWNVFI